MRLQDLAERTPAARDRYVDFLRALSIVTVIAGHWMIAMIRWQGGLITSFNAIGVTPWLWLATWFLQVMPLFFFVGGFSNVVSYESMRRKDGRTSTWLKTRALRLLRPTVVFLGVWVVTQVILHVGDVGAGAGFRLWGDTRLLRGMRPPGALIPFGLLWFLPVYFLVVMLAPFMIRLHRRFGVRVVVALLAACVAVDLVGFATGELAIRHINDVLVWLLPHQLGFFYADGDLTRAPRRWLWAMMLAGFAALIVLTNPPLWRFLGVSDWFSGLGSYPKSLLGVDFEPVTNTYPPSICIVAVTFSSIGMAMVLRDRLVPWVGRLRVWMSVIYLNGVIMTLYLWHMTAFLLAILLLWPLGFGHQQDSNLRWWLERPLWLVIAGVILAAFVKVFGRFEHPWVRSTRQAGTARVETA
jgi:fucose 4-O-acetylase-like acetyltransferase